MSSLTKIPAGVQYFFDDEVKLRRSVEARAMRVFAGWSYDEIILPMFDYHDLFARGMGVEKAEATYRFVDRDGALLALRPELTSLVARTVATRFLKRERPIRLSYSGEVFRYDEPTERAAREFHQLGVEHIGEPNIVADIEVLLVSAELLSSLGLTEFRIALSHAEFFNGIASHLELDARARTQMARLIDRRGSQQLAEFMETVAAHKRWRYQGLEHLLRSGGKREALDQALEMPFDNNVRAALEHLDEIYRTIEALGLDGHFDIDLGDAGGLEYYTGLTFKVYVPDWGVAVGSGGRYDNLIANFGASEPAVGFSFALDGLAGALIRQHKADQMSNEDTPQSIAVNGDLADAFRQARQQRQQGKQVKIDVK